MPPVCAPGPRRNRPGSADLRRFPPETALSPLPQGWAEPSQRGATEESEEIPEKPGQMFDIRRNSIHTNPRAGQFRPSPRIGIPISSYQLIPISSYQ